MAQVLARDISTPNDKQGIDEQSIEVFDPRGALSRRRAPSGSSATGSPSTSRILSSSSKPSEHAPIQSPGSQWNAAANGQTDVKRHSSLSKRYMMDVEESEEMPVSPTAVRCPLFLLSS